MFTALILSERNRKMKTKAVIFDIGQTLAYYPIPLNWSSLYRPAFESIAEKNGLSFSETEYLHAGAVLAKYNTRINPREREVTSDMVFSEIFDGLSVPMEYMDAVKRDFYSYFRTDVKIYNDVPDTLKAIRRKGIAIGTLSDVAYGMDNCYALADIEEILDLIDIPFTSNDVGFRKPCRKGLDMLAEKIGISTSEMMFVGDEKKDIECAVNAGAVAVLINRTDEHKDFGQKHTLKTLTELLDILSL